MSNRDDLTRRALFRLATGAAAAWTFFRTGLAHAKKLAVPLAKLPALEKVGGAVTIKLKGRPVLLIRDTKESVRAFDPTCTHKKCTVAWDPKQNKIACGCHHSMFDLDGKVLGGPAPAPLTRFEASLGDGRVIVTLPEPKKK